MNKPFRKIHFNRLKSRRSVGNSNPYYNTSGNANRNKDSIYSKTLKQLALCIAIVLVVILIKNVNTPITNKAGEWVDTSLSQEIDFRSSFNKVLKYARELPQIPKRVVNVFQNNNESNDSSYKLVPPINGEIISSFGENVDPILNQKTFQRGIDIQVSGNQSIKSIADGEVVEVSNGTSLGKYIKIKHDENLFSIYGNCSRIEVSQGQQVKQGQTIAEFLKTNEDSPYFHFELWVEGNVVDPSRYIQFSKRML